MTDMTKNEIDEKIAELQAQRVEIERKEHEQTEVERKKKEEEKKKELAAIKNAIKAFNEKHSEYYSLAKSIEIKADDFPRRSHLPSDFAIEFTGEPIDKIVEYFGSLLG